jgi:hypothetical protein
VAVRTLALVVLVGFAAACGAIEDETPAGPPLERYGIRVAVPDGWHARLTRGTLVAATVPLSSPSTPEIGAADTLVRLFEFEPDPAYFPRVELDSAYSDGPPRPFRAEDFRGPEEPSGGVADHGYGAGTSGSPIVSSTSSSRAGRGRRRRTSSQT